MGNRFCFGWFLIEFAVILLITTISPANAFAVPKWECTSAGGWSMSVDGRRTSILNSDVTTELEFSAHKQTSVLNAV